MDWKWHKDHCIARVVDSTPIERPCRDVSLLPEISTRCQTICTWNTNMMENNLYMKLRICLWRKNMGDGGRVGYMNMLNGCFTLSKVAKNVKPWIAYISNDNVLMDKVCRVKEG